MNNSPYLDPIAVATRPREDFIRHLLTAYPLRDEALREQLKQELDKPGVVWQHPYLEGAQPYYAADSVADLVEQGLLHSEMSRLFEPRHRSLYQHQQEAIAAVVQGQQNIVVATGTGSGKTECFLIPMMDALLKEQAQLHNPGVRALILYPMNALVNDQVKRLRKLLCRQDFDQPLIRFGFYTSRTERRPKEAEERLLAELQSYERQELLDLFSAAEQQEKDFSTPDKLVTAAAEKIQAIQAISREAIWEAPPHILVTNYSMLEHMLIRPKERNDIFAFSSSVFKLLIVDEAHTYNGSTGTEVSMLLKRFKATLSQPKGKIRCIATSASLGDEETNQEILHFAETLFDEPFRQIIRGKRQVAADRLGEPYRLSPNFSAEDIWEYLSVLELPEPTADVDAWRDELAYVIPEAQLEQALKDSNNDVHRLLWFALKQHPLIHRLINLLSDNPYPWETVFQSARLWEFDLPLGLDGEIDPKAAEISERSLANLLQLGTLAKPNKDDLPLLPVRLHLLFRSLEGLFQCINSNCRSVYLNSKESCDRCSAPVLELGSCSQCGQVYTLTQLSSRDGDLLPLPRTYKGLKDSSKHIYTATTENIASGTEDEDNEIADSSASTQAQTLTILKRGNGWIGQPNNAPFQPATTDSGSYNLAWHRQKDDKKLDGCYLAKCAACGYGSSRTYAIRRLVAYTDAPLEAMIDSLFQLLPEEKRSATQSSKRKLLAFSDGRQDAAFFASDFQRTHTELLYRQMIWQAFEQIKDAHNRASVGQVTLQLRDRFLELSVPHPDRSSELNYVSYVSYDEIENRRKNPRDCRDRAEARAKELLLREFAVAYARRISLEAYALLACHVELPKDLMQAIAERLQLSADEIRVFLTGLTDIIRRSGAVSISGASNYFPETGGVDGARRPMVHPTQGKTLIYLSLERNEALQKKHNGSFPFLKERRETRLSWYFSQFFPDKPLAKEDVIWLFKQLESEKIFVSAAPPGSYHLNWDLLTLWQTQQDWYKCDRCQQVAHVPGLLNVDETESSLNLRACRAFRCSGTLQEYEPDQIEAATKQHAEQYAIKHGDILPLRSQEHTAQLGTEELAKRENDFRQGKINLLSCSTTLEMGVDIGELQAVVLRNFPPHVSNYQQRAGRAGRRTDGVAITLMYGQRRPHDRFYFEQPWELIAGSNQIPRIDVENLQIQQRHIRAELIAAFLQFTRGVGTEEISIADFFNLTEQFDSLANNRASSTAMLSELRQWLQNPQAEELGKEWLERLNATETYESFRNSFNSELDRFESDQVSHWNDLISLLEEAESKLDAVKRDRSQRDQFERSRNNLEIELKKILNRRLHDQLVQAAILPIYGFPIDVVRLITEKSDFQKSSQGKHRLERDRRLALGEYAPGQNVIVDDRVYKSVGVLSPRKLEKKFYWVCKNCNHFESLYSDTELIEQCPTCYNTPDPRDMKVKEYRVPQAFITDWATKPDVTPYLKPSRQPTSQVFLASPGEQLKKEAVDGICQLTTSRNSRFFLANKGNFVQGGFCFRICESCGRDLSDTLTEKKNKKTKKEDTARKSHQHPILGNECKGNFVNIHLGHEFYSDLVKIKFERLKNLPSLFKSEQAPNEQDTSKEFWRSLTYALLAAAAQVIDVRREELDGLFVPVANGQAEIIIYDDLPGGAGYSAQIAAKFREVLAQTYKITATCSCSSSCYDCLRTYGNQIFHEELNRQIVAEFLQPLVDQVSPNATLQHFAPNAYRASLTTVADELASVSKLASAGSILYLPKLIDTYQLKQESPLSWLKCLEDIVRSTVNNGAVPELIVHDLPEATSQQNSLIRRRLSQWIDLGQIKLYKSANEQLPELCIVTAQQHWLALQLHQKESGGFEWLQTRSKQGGIAVLERLQQLKSRSTLVTASDLEDPDTTIILPIPTRDWQNLSIEKLRQKLGLEPLLTGVPIKSIVYSDRYIYKSEAEIIAALLKTPSVANGSNIEIRTRENHGDRSGSNRKSVLEKAFKSFIAQGTSVKVGVQPWHHRKHFPHARTLSVEMQDGQTYRVMFDQGLAFLEKKAKGGYSVTQPTYIVITRCSDR